MQITPITHISFPEDPLLYVTESLDNYFDRAEEKTLQKPELFWNFQNCQFYYLRLDWKNFNLAMIDTNIYSQETKSENYNIA